MEIVIADTVEPQAEGYAGQVRSGVVERQWFIRDKAADGLNLRFFRSIYREGSEAFESPRHHHGFQQIRWTESGSVNFGPGQEIEEGDIAYFPRAAYYGPQRKAQGVGILVQFGFGELSGNKMIASDEAEAERQVREDRLRSRGELPVQASPRHDQESMVEGDAGNQAVRAPIAAESYDAPILMHPAAYAYYEAAPGVEIRHLGNFYDNPGPEGDVGLMMARLSGGTFEFSADRAQLAWTVSAGLEIDGVSYPRMTCLYSRLGEADVVSGCGNVELFIVEFPRQP